MCIYIYIYTLYSYSADFAPGIDVEADLSTKSFRRFGPGHGRLLVLRG